MATKNTLRPRELADSNSAIEGPVTWRESEEQAEAVIALTTDPVMLGILRRLASPQELRAVPRETDFGRALLTAPMALAIIDSAAVTRFPIDQVARLLVRQFPQLRLVVVGTARDEAALADQIAAGHILQFLPKPISASRLRPLVDAALQPGAALMAPAAPAQAPLSGLRTWLIAAVLFALLAGATFFGLRSTYLSPEAAPAPASAPAAENPLEDLLAHADAALAGSAYDNAIEMYRKAQELSPGDPRIAAGLSRVERHLVMAAQTQLQDRHFDEAQILALQAKTLEPGNAQVAQLLADIAARQVRPESVPAPVSPPPAEHPRPLDERLHQVQELIRQGHLLDPPGANARSALAQAREIAPADPRLGPLQRELLSQILAEARRTLATGQDADRLISAATALGARPDEIDGLTRQAQRDKAAARSDAIERVAQLFNERLQEGRLVEPASDSAKFYLAQLATRDPSGPATQIARMALGTRLLTEAASSLRRKDLTAARNWVEEARAAGADAASIATIEADLASAQPAPPPPAPPAPQPSAGSTSVSTSAAADAGAPIQLKKIRDVGPVYPRSAFNHQLRGRVQVAYTVRTDGTTDDITILSADPPGVFEQAAIEAVRQWRYRPPQQPGGKPVPAKVIANIQFSP
jgi:TonB family protein